jgi:hypothetical protein
MIRTKINKYINEIDEYDEMAPRREKKGILHRDKLLLFPHSRWLCILKFRNFARTCAVETLFACWTIKNFRYSHITSGFLCAGKHRIMPVQYVCFVLTFSLS